MAAEPLGPDSLGMSEPSRGRGLRGWLGSLPLRDRLIYGGLIAILLVIVSIYVVMGIQLLNKDSVVQDGPSPVAEVPTASQVMGTVPIGETMQTTQTVQTAQTTQTAQTVQTAQTTQTAQTAQTTQTVQAVQTTPTFSPSSGSSPSPTDTPLVPTSILTPTSSSGSTSAVPIVPTPFNPSLAAISPTPLPPTDTPVSLPPPTSMPVAPTSTPVPPPPEPTPTPLPPAPTVTRGTAPPFAPTLPPKPPAPSPTPQPVTTREYLTLYFADATGSMLVPVTRLATVESKQVATAALRELAVGPQGDLQQLVPPDIRILDISRHEQTIRVNFDRHPGSDLSLRSIALTLTEFPGVTEVLLQANGTDLELDGQRGVFRRPVINVDNPQGLPTDYASGTRFLPLYFLQGSHYVRITRLVPRTTEVAQATVQELLPGRGATAVICSAPFPVERTLLR
ncbi:MAG: GerMN domain-containing protein [Chloroflexaceae bacterium]|nr:GerMN domain-containing protein [Chloroflexaceae bacterium]